MNETTERPMSTDHKLRLRTDWNPDDGHQFWAVCSCDKFAGHGTEADVRAAAARHLMTAPVSPAEPHEVGELATGPVDCAPWCEERDGNRHGDMLFRSDQACRSETQVVALSLMPVDRYGSAQRIEHDAWREMNGTLSVDLSVNGRAGWKLTPTEAAQLRDGLTETLRTIGYEPG